MLHRHMSMAVEKVKAGTASLKEALKGYQGEVRWDEPIATYTSLKVGGPADVMLFPGSLSEVIFLMECIASHGIPYFVLGNGSNLLVKEGGFKGMVLHLKHLNRIELIGIDDIFAEGGSSYPKLATFAMENHLGGLEFAAGIPGTVGGAVVMNAGIPGAETAAALINIAIVEEGGKLRDITPQNIHFGYRTTNLPKGVVVSAAFRLTPTPEEEIEKKLKSMLKKRRENQPLEFSNCGSVFKNPPNDKAGALIERAGLKGFRVGDAEISNKHGNFIVNNGAAKAKDVLALIKKMQEEVMSRFGVSLELEVKVIGADL